MKVGFATTKVSYIYLKQVCDQVISVEKTSSSIHELVTLIEGNLEQDIYVHSLDYLGLRLLQLLPALEIAVCENKILHFCEKESLMKLSDEDYFATIYDLSKTEKRIAQKRLTERYQALRNEGRLVGRPAIKKELIHDIQFFYEKEKKTMREIAKLTDLSLGTVHKYIKLSGSTCGNK